MNSASSSPALLLVAAGAVCTAAESTSLVAPLKNQGAVRGCQWNASAPALGAGYIFLAEWDETKILMNIDGKDVELQVTNDANRRPTRSGDMVKIYRAAGIEVRATYKVTWDCSQSANPEGCEVTKYSATYEVSKGDQRQSVQATGEVGC